MGWEISECDLPGCTTMSGGSRGSIRGFFHLQVAHAWAGCFYATERVRYQDIASFLQDITLGITRSNKAESLVLVLGRMGTSGSQDQTWGMEGCIQAVAIFQRHWICQARFSWKFESRVGLTESVSRQSCGSFVRIGAPWCLVAKCERRSRQVANLSGKERHPNLAVGWGFRIYFVEFNCMVPLGKVSCVILVIVVQW